MLKIIFALFLCATMVIAQINNGKNTSKENLIKVDAIEIFGNETTKDFVILKELTFSVGDSINKDILLFNRERVFSLGIFTKVSFFINQDSGKNSVQIYVEESWYIFPVPFLNVREKTFKRTSYGISLKYKNFRGRNETIRATASLGYDPFYSFDYENPLIFPSADISFYLTGAFGTPVNKSPTMQRAFGEEFDYSITSISNKWGIRLDKHINFFLILGYSNIALPNESINSYMASGTSVDRAFSAGIDYNFDTRNLRQFPSSGLYFDINYLHSGFGLSDISYNSVLLDFRKYQKLYQSLVIKGWMSIRHTFGEFVPYYNYSMLGYDYYTRGNRYLVREGNNRIITSVELTHPIIPEWNFAIDLPLLPKSLTRTRIAIHASIFADAATVYNNGDTIEIGKFNSGYGFGLTFLFLPYNSFRVEYAFNEYGKGELLIETGISF